MATGVQISSFVYSGAPVLNAVFGFFKASAGTQIQRLQITKQVAPTGGNVVVELINEAGTVYAGATVTLAAGTTYYDQPLAAPVTLGIGNIVRARITGVDTSGQTVDLIVNLIGATAQGSNAPSSCCGGEPECQQPTAQLLFFAGSVANEQAAAAASAAAAAASATAASGSATAAATSATAAAGSATAAAASATTAAASVTSAAAWATNANNAATASSVYASNASASATASANSATAAAASATAAAATAAEGIKGARTQFTAAAVKSIADATATAMIWDSIQFDDMAFWSGANPTRITIPAGVIRVRLSAGARWTANGTGERKLKIRSQGGPYAANTIWASDDRPSDDTGDATVNSGPINVVAGMYFEAMVEQDSTGALTLNTVAADNPGNFFAVEVLKQS